MNQALIELVWREVRFCASVLAQKTRIEGVEHVQLDICNTLFSYLRITTDLNFQEWQRGLHSWDMLIETPCLHYLFVENWVCTRKLPYSHLELRPDRSLGCIRFLVQCFDGFVYLGFARNIDGQRIFPDHAFLGAPWKRSFPKDGRHPLDFQMG